MYIIISHITKKITDSSKSVDLQLTVFQDVLVASVLGGGVLETGGASSRLK